MSAQTDIDHILHRAGSALVDAAVACQTARHAPISADQYRLLQAALRNLERAQDDLWKAGHESWTHTLELEPA